MSSHDKANGRRQRRKAANSRTKRFLMLAGGALLGLSLAVVGYNLLPGERFIETVITPEFSASDPQFQRSMRGVLGIDIDEGTAIKTLVNGDEIFPAMLDAIARAQRTITFETYIYWQGEIAVRFAQALIERARAGVSVKVILDAVGAGKMDPELVTALEAAGADVVQFRPIAWYTIDRWNHRTHRKILVVDGRVGFTGGVGIAEEWTGDAQDENHWRDTHYRVEGPAVAALQAGFAENWLEATGTVLKSQTHFPALEAAGPLATQTMRSSARSGAQNMHVAILMALSAAREHVRIAMAYFVPTDLAIRQLKMLRERGVEVEIVVPGAHHDVPMVRAASRHFWGELLEAGVRIYEYDATMYHPKLLLVDEAFATIGSVNFDERSFRLNDELNINVFDRDFALEQIAMFEADKARSREVTLAEWQNRSAIRRLRDWFWSLFRSQL